MNKKGQLGPLVSVLIMVLLVVGIVVIYFFWSLVAPPFVAITDTATQVMEEASVNNDNLNNATQATIVPVNQGFNNLEWMSYSLLIVMIMGFVFLAFLIRTYPFLLIFWFGFVIAIVFASIFMSNAYSDLANQSGLVGESYRNFETNNFILSYLPGITAAIGFLGGIILFVIVSRDPEVEAAI